jgi:radical SAM superfamily enzyme YgiQ (UPF0313 family)
MKELMLAREKWGIRRFLVLDDCFNADSEHAKKFSKAAEALGLEWMAGNGLRADRFDDELGHLMARSGCKWAAFGVESTDDDVLKGIKKGEGFFQIQRSVISALNFFRYVTVFLILGLPGSTYEKDRKSIAWAKAHGLGVHVSFYLAFNKETQRNSLFDRPEGRSMSQVYEPHLQMKLYNWGTA